MCYLVAIPAEENLSPQAIQTPMKLMKNIFMKRLVLFRSLLIWNENGQLVDMGMTLKDWCCVEPELCLTDYDQINEDAKSNRRLLLEIMQVHGFVNYPTEWWHFSYGDRYWAYHQPVKQAIFGSADTII